MSCLTVLKGIELAVNSIDEDSSERFHLRLKSIRQCAVERGAVRTLTDRLHCRKIKHLNDPTVSQMFHTN